MAQIKNSIIIHADFDIVFDLTNDIENWKNLFTEYKESKVLKKEGNYVLFQLTTVPDENNISRTWKSERNIDKANKKITARRIEPLLPFRFMNIVWFYREIGNQTEMTWIQDYEVDPTSGYSEQMVTAYLDKTSKEQLSVIKSAIEKETQNRAFKGEPR
jgi:aromatase